MSVVIHGGSPMLLAKIARKRALELSQLPDEEAVIDVPDQEPVVEVKEKDTRSLPVLSDEPVKGDVEVGAQSITIEELHQLQQSGQQVIILDVRTDRSLDTSDQQVKGAVRLPPDHVAIEARELKLPQTAWLIAYCA